VENSRFRSSELRTRHGVNAGPMTVTDYSSMSHDLWHLSQSPYLLLFTSRSCCQIRPGFYPYRTVTEPLSSFDSMIQSGAHCALWHPTSTELELPSVRMGLRRIASCDMCVKKIHSPHAAARHDNAYCTSLQHASGHYIYDRLDLAAGCNFKILFYPCWQDVVSIYSPSMIPAPKGRHPLAKYYRDKLHNKDQLG
jgi:hypothetical protein